MIERPDRIPTPLLGLNEDENPFALRRNDLISALNISRYGNLVGTRPGFQFEGASEDYTGDESTGTVLNTGASINGIYEFRNQYDATRHLLVVSNGDVWYDEGNTLGKTGVSIGSGQNDIYVFADWNGYVFMAGGSGGSTFNYWDGDTGNDVLQVDIQGNNPGTPPTMDIYPRYVYQKWGVVFASGFDGGSTPSDAVEFDNNPMVIRYHDYGEDATDGSTTGWPLANTIGPGVAGSATLGNSSGWGAEYTTGLGEYQDNNGDYLLQMTNRRIYAYVPAIASGNLTFTNVDAIANGCVHQRAFVNLGLDSGDAMWVSEQGIHSIRMSQQYGGREQSFLSWPIRKTFQTIRRDRLKYTVGAYWPTEGIVLFAFTTGANTKHDLILCADIRDVDVITPATIRWYEWRLGSDSDVGDDINVNTLAIARDANDTPYIYMGTTTGEVCRLTRTDYDDLGRKYPVEFQTPHDAIDAPSQEKSLGDVTFLSVGNGDHKPTHTVLTNFGVNTVYSDTWDLPAAGTPLGTAPLGTFPLGGGSLTPQIVSHAATGTGETFSHRFSHPGGNAGNEPFWIGHLEQEFSPSGDADGSNF